MTAPLRIVSARTVLLPVGALASAEIVAVYDELEADAAHRLGPVAADDEVVAERVVAVRYVGQWHELSIPFDADPDRLTARFEDEHERLFGTRLGDPLELVECSVALTLAEELPESIWQMSALERSVDEEIAPRYVYLIEEVVPVFARSALAGELSGPCVVEEAQSVTWVPPGATVRLAGNHLVLELAS
jgi:N-methylhydantoinase A